MKNEIIKIFYNLENILYVGGESTVKENIESTNNEEYINKFINTQIKSVDCKFIITTYDSCHKIPNINFDLKIGDESHHLVGSQYEKTKHAFHKIKSDKTLFMTATEKIIECSSNNKYLDKIIYSMNDETIFGKLIDFKSINWAIENKKISDYNLIILKNTEDEINNIIKSLNLVISYKELFFSAFMALKSIEKYNDLTHLLIYTNKTENSKLVEQYIEDILNLNIINIDKDNYYNKALHSKSNDNFYDRNVEGKVISSAMLVNYKI